MNTLAYLKHVICDEIRAIKEEILESKLLFTIFLIVLVGLIFYLKPFSDRHIHFLAAYPNSDWSRLAESSARELDKSGIKMTVLSSNGAVENVVRLNNPEDPGNVGFTYGLALEPGEFDNIYSLGSVGYEPVWILYNKKKLGEVLELKDLAQYKIGLGPINSGSYRIAKKIFNTINIDIENNAHFEQNSFIDNKQKLVAGKIDVVVFVATNLDSIVQDIMLSPGIEIFDFKNAPAFAKKFNAFTTLILPMDSISINANVPKKDITMLATTTSLVVKKSMHPDLQLAILMAVKDANRISSNLFFAKRNEFPAYLDPSIPISPIAEHFYDYGPPHAMKYLPYWLAGLMDRAWILLLTIFAIFYPLSKLNIHFRRYRFNLREVVHYKELIQIERRLQAGPINAQEKQELLARLNEINSHAISLNIPISEEAAYFSFLNALSLLRKKIQDA